VRWLLWALIVLYRRVISPYKGFCCAYHVHTGRASCSALGLRAVRLRGGWQGLALIKRRTALCGVAARRYGPQVARPRVQQRGDCDCGVFPDCGALPDCDLPGSRACDVADCCQGCDCGGPDRKGRSGKGRSEAGVRLPPRKPSAAASRQATAPAPMPASSAAERMRQRVRSDLQSLTPLDAVEAGHLHEALAWVDSGAPLHRTARPATPPRHLVAYFAVLDGDHVLLVDHRNAGLWLPTGGHVEPGEDPRATVARELHEELGLRIAREAVGPPVMVTVTETVGATAGHVDVSLWYVVHGDRSADLQFDRTEFHQVRWFAFDALPHERCEPHLARFVAKLVAARA